MVAMSNFAIFSRRLGAMFYDGVLLGAVLFVASAMFTAATGASTLSRDPVKPFFQVYLLAVSFIFYGWFWVHGGQTLGLRAWRLRVVRIDGGPVTWRCAALRFLSALLSWAPFGLGVLWALFDPKQRTWHDRLSRTRLATASAESPPDRGEKSADTAQ